MSQESQESRPGDEDAPTVLRINQSSGCEPTQGLPQARTAHMQIGEESPLAGQPITGAQPSGSNMIDDSLGYYVRYLGPNNAFQKWRLVLLHVNWSDQYMCSTADNSCQGVLPGLSENGC